MLFRDARLKLDRANKHIADLDVFIGALPDRDVATIEINPKFGNEVIKHDVPKTAMADMAVIAGDAAHNLKCSLDYSWFEIIRKLVPSAVGKFTKFPIYPTPQALEAALRGKEIHIGSPELFRLMLNQICPYEGGNFGIWPIHKLDIRDKHRLLIPVIFYSSISGIETKHKVTGDVSRDGFTMATEQEPPYYIDIPIGWRVQNKGRVSVGVMFEYAEGGYQFRIIDSFALYSSYIAEVVQKLEAFLQARGFRS